MHPRRWPVALLLRRCHLERSLPEPSSAASVVPVSAAQLVEQVAQRAALLDRDPPAQALSPPGLGRPR